MSRDGVVLIEVLVALVILSTAGVSTVVFVGAHSDAQHRVFQREEELVRAERLLVATSLLHRTELDQRLGLREVGHFRVRVARPEPSLYRISVGRSVGEEGMVESLMTIVFRPEEAPSAP